MSVALRPYQTDLLTRAMSALGSHRRVLVQCPTGFGKTVIAAATAETVGEVHQRVWFICHRAELVHQTSQTFAKAGVPHSFIAAGRPFDAEPLVHICSIDTLKARLAKVSIKPDLIIWDDCHHLGAAGWTAVMERYLTRTTSACPLRLAGSTAVAWTGTSTSWLKARRSSGSSSRASCRHTVCSHPLSREWPACARAWAISSNATLPTR